MCTLLNKIPLKNVSIIKKVQSKVPCANKSAFRVQFIFKLLYSSTSNFYIPYFNHHMLSCSFSYHTPDLQTHCYIGSKHAQNHQMVPSQFSSLLFLGASPLLLSQGVPPLMLLILCYSIRPAQLNTKCLLLCSDRCQLKE